MSVPVEREFKLRLPDESAWRAVRASLGGATSTPVLQANHFFDTSRRDLRRVRLALRLREERGTATLTLKGPAREEGALSARPELELALQPDEARALLAGEVCPLELLGASPLGATELVRWARACAGAEPARLLGGFENERTRVGPVPFPPGSRGPGLVFELDRTRFPGGRLEHELELELPEGSAPEPIETGLRELLARLGLPFVTPPSKAARLFRILDGAAAEE